jgi:hypothetical protein
MAFRMKGFSGFGDSPLKKDPIVLEKKEKQGEDRKIDQKLVTSIDKTQSPKPTSSLQDFGKEVSEAQNFLTSKHTIFKNKRFSLQGQVDMPEVNVGWEGGPKVNTSVSGRLEASYRPSKNVTLRGGANIQNRPWSKDLSAGITNLTKAQPYWASLNINF